MTLLDSLREAGLTGRGGAAFPTHVKIAAAYESGADLIVNACDGERGANKDGWVVENHLAELVEGAAQIARGRRQQVTYAAHRQSRTAALLLGAGLPVLEVPERYVASEQTALIAFAHGRRARPLVKRDLYVSGGRDSRGRKIDPTVVVNAETVWRVAQIARHGSQWFRSFGTPDEPGPRLASVSYRNSTPWIVETAAGVRLRQILQAASVPADHGPVLLNGLGGGFVSAREARAVLWSGPGLSAVGLSLGPGVIEVLDAQACPLIFVRDLLQYAAGESAGQCGPCMFGLPALAADWARAVASTSSEARRQIGRRVELLPDRGACRFPDGVAHFTATALRVFGSHFAEHRRRVCPAVRGLAHAS